MNPRSRDEQKNPFCVSSKNNYFEDNVKTVHWVGHSQLISPDKDYFFKITPGIDEKQASVTGNTTKQSVSGGEKNLVLLQEKEENYLKRLIMTLM